MVSIKIILRESGFIMALEIPDRSIKPDRLSKIEPVAYFIQRAEHLVRPRILPGIFDDGISDQMIIFKYFCPQTEHGRTPFCILLPAILYYTNPLSKCKHFSLFLSLPK